MGSIDDNSLQSNNFELQKFEHLPGDYVFNSNETVETFFVQGDLIFNLDDESFGWSQELLPENETEVSAPIEKTDDVSSVSPFQLSAAAEEINNDLRPEKILTTKRSRNPQNWKANIAKINRQSGKPYVTKKGVKRSGKFVKKTGCANESTCPFQCMTKIDRDGRQYIYDSFWALDDKEKRHFYVSNVKRSPCARKRTKSETSQKDKSFQYFFNYMHVDIQVCQQFFVNTLNINKGRVYYFFGKSNERKTVTPGPSMHGKHTKKVLDERHKQEVRDHINKFPRMESHYCRQNTNKQYLDPGLNLSQMYRLYATESENPLKFSAYRNIFNYEFNLAFFHPKKDRCEKCVEHEQLRNPSEQQIIDCSQHRQRKTNAHNERNKDRDEEPESVVAEFDLENVFQLPIANASILFYLRKFGVYNLTVVVNKIVYNIVWNEFICGRAGTHLASALVKALKRIVLDNSEMVHLTLWSDSCVPQNRNSFMSAAIQEFLNSDNSGKLQTIYHKYSEAGHGEVQNVDCAHSVIEKFLRGKFIYSPVSLLKELRKIPQGKSQFVILEMEDSDYFDYETLAQASKYTVIPYKRVVQLCYKKNDSKISFKLDFEDDFNPADILLKQSYKSVPELQGLELHSTVTTGKIADIQKMYGIMPETDRVYYQNGFKKVTLAQAVTSMRKDKSDINDHANEGPNTSCLGAEHIENPKESLSGKAGRKVDNKKLPKNADAGAKQTKTARRTSGFVRRGTVETDVGEGPNAIDLEDENLDDSKEIIRKTAGSAAHHKKKKHAKNAVVVEGGARAKQTKARTSGVVCRETVETDVREGPDANYLEDENLDDPKEIIRKTDESAAHHKKKKHAKKAVVVEGGARAKQTKTRTSGGFCRGTVETDVGGGPNAIYLEGENLDDPKEIIRKTAGSAAYHKKKKHAKKAVVVEDGARVKQTKTADRTCGVVCRGTVDNDVGEGPNAIYLEDENLDDPKVTIRKTAGSTAGPSVEGRARGSIAKPANRTTGTPKTSDAFSGRMNKSTISCKSRTISLRSRNQKNYDHDATAEPVTSTKSVQTVHTEPNKKHETQHTAKRRKRL